MGSREWGPHLLGLVSSQGDKTPELALPSPRSLSACRKEAT